MADSSLVSTSSEIIILNDNAKIQVSTTRNLFIRSCEAWLKENKDEQLQNLHEIIKNNKSHKIILSRMSDLEDFNPWFTQIFESLLLEGNCLIYNKSSKNLESNIYYEGYVQDNVLGIIYKTQQNVDVLITEMTNCF